MIWPARKHEPSRVPAHHTQLKATRLPRLSRRRALSSTTLLTRSVAVFGHKIQGSGIFDQSFPIPRRTTSALARAANVITLAHIITIRPISDVLRDAPRSLGPPPSPSPSHRNGSSSIGGGLPR